MKENRDVKELMNRMLAEDKTRNHTRAEELRLQEYIRTKDERAIDYGMESFKPEHGGILHHDQRISQLYRAIGAMTLLTRYCIDAGLPEDKAYTVSDFLLQQLEPDSSEEEINIWYKRALTTFVSLIPDKEPAGKIHSPLVARAMDYCLSHPYSPLLLKDAAAELYVHPDYLSQIFKHETGMTYTRFVRHLKIETARDLLRYTDKAQSEIAAMLSFSSESYFIRIFKEECGMTPHAYRKALHT